MIKAASLLSDSPKQFSPPHLFLTAMYYNKLSDGQNRLENLGTSCPTVWKEDFGQNPIMYVRRSDMSA